ncbi:MAG: D-aminoacylase [Dehalococcoidia bacterium]|nr:D-aminoacylase [Dehalococcoidia bacterium]
MTDILIRNGRVLDGTGNPWFRGDVAITDGRIEYVGKAGSQGAARVIDARDMCVCPGFIDMHAHADLTVFYKDVQDYKLRQGITTEVAGNCGFTAAPLDPDTEEMLKRYMAFITPPSGVSWDWRTLGEYLHAVDASSPSTNIAPLVGHGTVRIAVTGFDQRAPSAAELERMRALVADAMGSGAFGLSTGLVYVPGTYAETEEIVELARVAGEYGGIYATHMRNEGQDLVQSVAETIEIGRRAGLPVQVSHHKAVGRAHHGKVRDSLALIERTRAEGLDITIDQYPYQASSTTLQAVLPPWAQEGGVDQVVARLEDADARERIRGEVLNAEGETRMGATLDKVTISSLPGDANQRFIGRNIQEIAGMRGQDPVDAIFDLLLEERCAVAMVSFSMSEEDVRTVMVHSTMMVGTDGLYTPGNPHPRVYGTYPRILGRYVREEGLLSLEDAVRRMTSFPARKLGLASKGMLRPGADADVVVFDPDMVIDRATFEEARQYPEGIEYVLVNGRVSVEGGRFTGDTAGRVLRRGRA